MPALGATCLVFGFLVFLAKKGMEGGGGRCWRDERRGKAQMREAPNETKTNMTAERQATRDTRQSNQIAENCKEKLASNFTRLTLLIYYFSYFIHQIKL